MIDINLYRSRIGTFSPRSRRSRMMFKKLFRNLWSTNDQTGVFYFSMLEALVKLVLVLAPLLPCGPTVQSPPSAPSFCWTAPTTACLQPGLCGEAWLRAAQSVIQFRTRGRKETSNFQAKYLYGNKNRGIYNAHLNIRSLNNKMCEIKKLGKEHSPHIFGLSECELRKVDNQYDESKLKLPGYDVLFPKSWMKHGFARVIVYVKKSLEYEQVHDLEDDQVQSVWLRGGFKNARKIYFCHGYREHTSCLGNSLSAQRSNLEYFLSQWEAAAEFSTPAEPNEVHICCDMNLDCLNDRWLQSDDNLVQNCYNMNNFSQLVMEPTRLQYNSVQNTTSISCIDHVYTKVKHRCSNVTVTCFGSSDHDMISYSRYSKELQYQLKLSGKDHTRNLFQKNILKICLK